MLSLLQQEIVERGIEKTVVDVRVRATHTTELPQGTATTALEINEYRTSPPENYFATIAVPGPAKNSPS